MSFGLQSIQQIAIKRNQEIIQRATAQVDQATAAEDLAPVSVKSDLHVGIGAAPTTMIVAPETKIHPMASWRQAMLDARIATEQFGAVMHDETQDLNALEVMRQSFVNVRDASRVVSRSLESDLVDSFIDYAQLAETECNEIIAEIEQRQVECAVLDELLQIVRTQGDKADLGKNDDPKKAEDQKKLMDRARELGVKYEGYSWKNSKEKEALMDNIKAVRSQRLSTNDTAHIKLKRATSIYERGMMTATSLMSIFEKIANHIIRLMAQ